MFAQYCIIPMLILNLMLTTSFEKVWTGTGLPRLHHLCEHLGTEVLPTAYYKIDIGCPLLNSSGSPFFVFIFIMHQISSVGDRLLSQEQFYASGLRFSFFFLF